MEDLHETIGRYRIQPGHSQSRPRASLPASIT